MTGSDKYSSLLRHGINMGRKKVLFLWYSPWALYYKTFYDRNLRIFCNKPECLFLASLARLGWKGLPETNTLITTVKNFIVQAPGTVFTTLHYLRNLRIGPISMTVL